MSAKPEVIVFKEGGYRYIKAGMPFSSGVASEPGYEIERVRLVDPKPLKDGYPFIENHLRSIGRPGTAFASCELRTGAPFTEQGFFDFNSEYASVLARWGIYRDGVNPVARTNVCPEYGKPEQPVLHAFSYTVPAKKAGRGTFIIAGGAEVRGGVDGYAARTVRYGESSPDAMKEKVKFVVALMEQRMAALGFSWKDASRTQIFSVQDIGALVGPEIAARGAAARGLTWHYARPPVVGLELEMDVRATAREISL